MIINWGYEHTPEFLSRPVTGCGPIINAFDAVGRASNKLTCFRTLQDAGVSIPEFTTDHGVAANWLHEERVDVLERNHLRGHSGSGIVLRKASTNGEDITQITPDCPLLVKYIKKQHEYRVHVFRGEVIDVQQKRKSREVPNEQVDYQIRNHSNGWIFARDAIDPPVASVSSNAVAAVHALGLDFGAVDVIYNAKADEAYVLEINTAPGLEGTTLDKYAEAIRGIL